MVKNALKDVKYKEYYIPLSPDIRYTLVLGAFPVKMTLGRKRPRAISTGNTSKTRVYLISGDKGM